MTTLDLDTVDTMLVVSAPAPTVLVAALDPPLVLTVAPIGAALAVTVVQTGVLTAPSAQGPVGPQGIPGPVGSDYGYAYYSDARYTATSPLAVMTSAPTLLTVDGLGSFSDSSQLRTPFQNWQFWRMNRFYPKDVADSYVIQISFIAMSMVIDNVIRLSINAGDGVGSFYDNRQSFSTVAGESRTFNFQINLFDAEPLFLNGATVVINPITAPILIWKASILIQPISVGQ